MKPKIQLWDIVRIVVPLVISAYLLRKAWENGLDLRVYWAGARAFVNGDDLYARGLQETLNGGMAFTYPPFAAALFSPMAFLPFELVKISQALLSLAMACTLGTLITRFLVYCRVLRSEHTRGQFLLTVGLITGLVLMLGPWRVTLSVGQINPLLMVLVVLDLIRPTRGHSKAFLPQGILTGIAAGIKLTPLTFLLYFVIRKDFKSAARMLGTFLATVTLMWVLTPSYSVQYWLSSLLDTNRVGSLLMYENVSIRGFVARFRIDDGTSTALWVIGAVAAISLGALAIHRQRESDNQWVAVSATALVMLLVSPVSWDHHWVWLAVIIPAVMGSWSLARPRSFHLREFARSWAGVLTLFTVGGFALGSALAAQLTGTENRLVGVSTLSEVAAELGMFGGMLILGWFALSPTCSGRDASRRPGATVRQSAAFNESA
ncbi:glycosyltransferase 87 family protein [Arthrobacter oryzae]|uniref:glycosyltransferase 87 family protein n=1 Tax=Arthrobacter oryzae TaxID=409290 RepID=UPI0027831897|nr:glycosyltransferase 87 family protein [Arthrobacter oryzae]MDQ0078494.1 alpha-1,2-mannosyltransferase [Arthrobacter oryzae]